MTDDRRAINPEDLDDVEFGNDRERMLFNTARIGMETKAFFESEVGQNLKQYAIEHIQNHAAALIEADAGNTDHIRSIQLEARVAGMFIQFVNQAINDGTSAAQELKNQEDYTRG